MATTVTKTLDAEQEAAFQFLMDRANANLAIQKKKPFPSLSAYVSYLLDEYVAMETRGVAAEKKAVALAKLQSDPASLTAEDRVVLGIK